MDITQTWVKNRRRKGAFSVIPIIGIRLLHITASSRDHGGGGTDLIPPPPSPSGGSGYEKTTGGAVLSRAGHFEL